MQGPKTFDLFPWIVVVFDKSPGVVFKLLKLEIKPFAERQEDGTACGNNGP